MGLLLVMLGALLTGAGITSKGYCTTNLPHIFLLCGLFSLMKGLSYIGSLIMNKIFPDEEQDVSHYEIAQFLVFMTLHVAFLFVTVVFWLGALTCVRFLK